MGLPSNLQGQPRASGAPIANNRGRRKTHQLGDFLDFEAAKKAALDDHCLARRDFGKLVERGIQSQQIALPGGDIRGLIEDDEFSAARPFFRRAAAENFGDRDSLIQASLTNAVGLSVAEPARIDEASRFSSS